MKKFLCIFMTLISMMGAIAQTPNYQGIIYVTPTGAGTHSGDSWVNATSSIDTAQILAQANNAVVWVAAGIYYGNTDSTAENAFVMTEGVNVYGGFAGNESADYDLSLRNFNLNTTILDGLNVKRVLKQPTSFFTATIWDGFIIQHGNATSQLGGGVYIHEFGIINHCVIRNNSAFDGGGVCVINNSSNIPSKIINCLVLNNTATYGGGMYMCGGTVINSTIVRNEAHIGAGLSGDGSNNVTNSIIWGNGTEAFNNIFDFGSINISYSAIEGGYLGDHNIILSDYLQQEPLFVNPSSGFGASVTSTDADWHLQQGSACINRGNNSAVSDVYDLNGSNRIKLDTVDLGCYESDYYSSPIIVPSYSDIVYVTENGAGAKTGENWDNATSSISFAATMANMCHADVWVKSGIYFGDTSSSHTAFLMVKEVNVYGGFAGNEPEDYDLSLRNFETNTTILDGMNTRRVLSVSNLLWFLSWTHYIGPFEQTIWDGFTIQNGHSFGSAGGVLLEGNAKVNQCIIKNNRAADGGGIEAGCGLYGFATISNCLISNNTATDRGGGVHLYNSRADIINSTIVRNRSFGVGAGVYAEHFGTGDGSLINSIIWGNGAETLNNLFGNTICSYSAIEGGYEGDHNIDISNMSLFVNPSLTSGADDDTPDVDWHLLPNTVCIDNGLNDSVTSYVDLDGLPRINCGTVDMGCYEYYPSHEFYDTANNSFVWHNTTYTTSGDYYWIDSTTSNCDTIHILHLSFVGIDDHNLGASMAVYPNPTTGVVNVECTMNNGQAEAMEFQLFDAFGRLLRTTDVVGANNYSSLRTDPHGSSVQTTQINLSHYASGIYFIKAVADGKVMAVRKVIKN